ncbi:family 10 glycosylhydrolase [Limnoraphis robusta Tam1]|uniref:Family 10 glycosylhydrolase n=1 Tax=Limnoraphis robusta CCNP1315 TaxID=3110306 RepID=A0ABU5TZ60_9CYAN|nr:family 10 glycosylhydrolase [Limnoraphis robusta]MEA5495959.1 family 10 glycosylhydrolase [Limnoraphis robusta BA-68 BA1]MEA5519987.1 family 10 glycosylhydrolase [Limnoraphis robusta CCNP1315]MEA5540768.1 family 10 glycosylhydrolase [Limnoraphis robusta Tam1]MEA5544907.1 family 10 glycosylhydrolase [Limnoraphis robusta CCNP1324]
MNFFLWPTQRLCDSCEREECKNGCRWGDNFITRNIEPQEWEDIAIEVFGTEASNQFRNPKPANEDELEASVLRRFNVTEPIDPARISVEKDEPDFLPYNYFEMGKKCGQSVCRLLNKVNDEDRDDSEEWLATGFLVGRRHLLTNYHVFYETICKGEKESRQEHLLEEIPLLNGKYVAEFGYEQDYLQREVKSLKYSLNKVLLYSKELDYALVEIGKEPLGRRGLQAGDWFGWLQLSRDPNTISPPWSEEIKKAFESQAKARQVQDQRNQEAPITYDIKNLEKRSVQGEPVVIIQHPQGKRKQVVVSSNRTIKLYKNYLYYEADIDFGSSGSPVFNQQWQLVALHNMAILEREDSGDSNDGETNVEAKQGVRICRIVEDIHEKVTKLLENPADNKKKLYVLKLWDFFNEYIDASVGLKKINAFDYKDLLNFLVKRLKKAELRGIWIPYIPGSKDYGFSEESMKSIIEKLKDLNFNTIYISVWVYGRPTYSSNVLKDKQLPVESPEYLLNLKKIVDFCKDQGLRVIANFESGFKVSKKEDDFYYEESWFLKKSDGNPYEEKDRSDSVIYRWLDPFKSEIQEFVLDLIGEIVGDYDFDGIQLNGSFGFPPEYDNRKEDMKSSNITLLMKKVFEKVKDKNKDAVVSLNIGYNFRWYAQKALLDWQTWEQKGYIEELILSMSVKDKEDLPYSLLPHEVKLAFKHIPVARKIDIGENMTREDVKQLIDNSQRDGFIGVYLSCPSQLASLESDRENSILNGLFQYSADPPTVSDFF